MTIDEASVARLASLPPLHRDAFDRMLISQALLSQSRGESGIGVPMRPLGADGVERRGRLDYTTGQRIGTGVPVRSSMEAPIAWTRWISSHSSTKVGRPVSTTMRPSTITVWTLRPSAL